MSCTGSLPKRNEQLACCFQAKSVHIIWSARGGSVTTKLLLGLVPLVLGATIIDTGSANLICFDLNHLPNPSLTATGPVASLSCPAIQYGDNVGLDGFADGMSVEAQVHGLVWGANVQFTGQMHDTLIEHGGVGLGTERFRIVFDWFTIASADPVSADLFAIFYFNGVPVWQEEHYLNARWSEESVVTVDEPFTYGQHSLLTHPLERSSIVLSRVTAGHQEEHSPSHIPIWPQYLSQQRGR
jgi:hypothetical protein